MALIRLSAWCTPTMPWLEIDVDLRYTGFIFGSLDLKTWYTNLISMLLTLEKEVSVYDIFFEQCFANLSMRLSILSTFLSSPHHEALIPDSSSSSLLWTTEEDSPSQTKCASSLHARANLWISIFVNSDNFVLTDEGWGISKYKAKYKKMTQLKWIERR